MDIDTIVLLVSFVLLGLCFAKPVYSVLISDVRGKAGNVVFSNWKGQSYIRKLVIPSNPQSAGQVTQRGFMSFWVAFYQVLEAQVKDYLKTLTEGRPISGFNLFVQRNVKDDADAVDVRMIPLNTAVNPVTTPGISSGPGDKVITITWDQANATTGDKIYVLAAEMTGADVTGTPFLQEKETTTVETETKALTMPSSGQKYRIWWGVEHEADSSFSTFILEDETSGSP